MPDLRDKRVDLILQQLEGLPTLPAVALRVLEVTSNDESSAKEVTDLIATDPALTARILHLVHRSDLGVRGEVNSIERAVILLGFDAVRSAVLAVSVFNTFQHTDPKHPGLFTREEFWKHCVAVACCAELLADAMGGKAAGIDRSEAFVCGLLHDLGKVRAGRDAPQELFARRRGRRAAPRKHRGPGANDHRSGPHGRRQAAGREVAAPRERARLHLAARATTRGAAGHRAQPETRST
jgi:putative nucleotidyltransferase with HDIG domain